MNISNGGPHLLLFERDQQLASLLTSELQLVGYECHTARTAVEVFDAIARFPIRLVLVNLAQAAAARREFWVALDTQRRGRGVQVFTFHCVNLASYGAQDPEERAQTTMADMEVDGMMGLMNLVDAVRLRVPGPGSATNTMPRMSKVSMAPPPVSPRPTSISPAMNSTMYRGTPPSESQSYQPAAFTNVTQAAPQQQPPAFAMQQQAPAFSVPSPDPGDIGTNQPSYTDRIRAVLYPNQKTWSSPTGLTPPPEIRAEQDLQRPTQSTGKTSTGGAGATALQRLASGQTEIDGARESGLAQLSRLLQEYRAPATEGATSAAPQQVADTALYSTTSRVQTPPGTNPLVGTLPVQPAMNQMMADTQTAAYSPQVVIPSPVNNIEVRSPRQDEPSIGMQPLRASPIQDLTENRNATGQLASEGYARQGYSSQVPGQTASMPPLSSIVSMPAPTPASTPPPAYPSMAAAMSAAKLMPGNEELVLAQIEEAEDKRPQPIAETASAEKFVDKQEPADYISKENSPAVTMHGAFNPSIEAENPPTPNNATLIDIMESFPPMPPPQAQSPQPTVLNGRATRSLGSVLLAGHLVPENRLEVAQHIQRMLSGVDMNYQLGEILLMFKLLTPDQLLAASLVSYGLITTQQISALGRIRQELHAIGLEYDLENLLILFRILTPEQIREAKSNRQS